MKNPLLDLSDVNQSVWLDFIERSILNNGDLNKLIIKDGIRGITTNPSIFHQAVTNTSDYDAAIADLQNQTPADPRQIFYQLALRDIQDAADMLKQVYDNSKGRDGYVSIEVSPELAYDTDATINEARQLFQQVGRPNCMIKVPATREGIPAIETLIAEGINVNATLLFSVDRYREVAQAYINGLEYRQRKNLSVDHIASVASFFISRVDALTDRLLEEKMLEATAEQRNQIAQLKGQIAISNAKLAYEVYKEMFINKRFGALRQAGAVSQRLLWASTGTKNPQLSDVLYVETLIGPDTVNTMPPATMDAFRDHGKVEMTLEDNVDMAQLHIDALQALNIDLQVITTELENDGVIKFQDAFQKLLSSIEDKMNQVTNRQQGQS